MAAGNKSLGRFDLTDIPVARRGMPQIEVTFNIDANGILNVGAKDKATGKEQSIIIKASSGLSDDEIQKMIKDAEAHAEEDRLAKEMVEARNMADNLIHASRKSLEELGDKVQDSEKKEIEDAIRDLEASMKTDNKADIEAKTRKLTEVSGKLAERAYKEASAGEQQANAGAGGANAGSGKANDDNVVDAEFEEVKDDKK
jgi:molecular chaperone DnaK